MYLYAPQGTLDPRGLSVIDPRLQMDRVSLVDPRLQAPAPEYTMPIWLVRKRYSRKELCGYLHQ